MPDIWVLYAQDWVNKTYGAHIGMTVEVDGIARWEVMYALTRALQLELGITALTNSFGPTTLSTLTTKYPVVNASTVPDANFRGIIQAAMYCKGYAAGSIGDGAWGTSMQCELRRLKTEMGVAGASPDDSLTPKMVKALLTMESYVLVDGGTAETQAAQRWMNGRYLTRSDYFMIPCDGRSSRDVAKALILGVQYELGLADGAATGSFGPATREGLRSRTLSVGSTGPFVSLFTAAMNVNRHSVAFTSTFTAAHAAEIQAFQSFVKLPVTGQGDYQTWASLLISYGDQDRRGEVCDGVTKITAARAATLKAEGVKYVGRYLTTLNPATLPEKKIQPGELSTIAAEGLRCFPIYQTSGRAVGDFNYSAGRAAGYAAMNAAVDHGFRSGTRIFFAVDFDAQDGEVTAAILPYFKGIHDAVADTGNQFEIGIYGARNVCSRVAAAGHSTASFVADMSSAYSGNLGYPLPADWAYDQIVTRTIGSGTGQINVDINIASGRDIGQNAFNPPRAAGPDTALATSLHAALGSEINQYMESIGFPENGGTRTYTHQDCLNWTVIEQDALVTAMSIQHNMRKAMIQTSAYWECRQRDAVDDIADLEVQAYHNGIPGSSRRDASTGIAQIFGEVAIIAWNHAIAKGYESGTTRDPANDGDLYSVWSQLKDDNAFAIRTVPIVHLWAADGKPNGSNPDAGETDMRPMALDYNDREVFEIIRRYQGWDARAVEDAGKRMPLYYIFEKYNAIARNL
jgi:peptidoglycan hydrolase-like protein with peptidoglycan-binding domain